MTRHPASASRIAVAGISVAGTLLAVGGFSYRAQVEQVEKARNDAAAMRAWNEEQARRDAEARDWARTHPIVTIRTVYRKVYVSVAVSGGTAPSGRSASAADPRPARRTSGAGSRSAPVAAPAAARPAAAPAPAAPPPASSSGGS